MRDLAAVIRESRERVPAMTPESIDLVRRLQAVTLEQPQVPVETLHAFHAGTYARTIMIPADSFLVGALIRIPTLLIFSGDALVYLGDGHVHLVGYHVLQAEAIRKQIIVTRSDSFLTMVFATEATTVAEAEDEFTEEAHMLLSRRMP